MSYGEVSPFFAESAFRKLKSCLMLGRQEHGITEYLRLSGPCPSQHVPDVLFVPGGALAFGV